MAHFGLKCSSFSTVNIGTSGRMPCTPYGNLDYQSVRDGNTLASRLLGFNSFQYRCVHLEAYRLMLGWHPDFDFELSC